jgi:hypothetical protein
MDLVIINYNLCSYLVAIRVVMFEAPAWALDLFTIRMSESSNAVFILMRYSRHNMNQLSMT